MQTLEHELAHGLYSTNDVYKEAVAQSLSAPAELDSLGVSAWNGWVNVVKRNGFLVERCRQYEIQVLKVRALNIQYDSFT